MNAYPAEHSVLVLDNCRIYHNEALVDLVHSAGTYCILLTQLLYQLACFAGCMILYLPAYSPDLNPIEESFSTCALLLSFCA
jgi:transposase